MNPCDWSQNTEAANYAGLYITASLLNPAFFFYTEDDNLSTLIYFKMQFYDIY